MMCKIENGGELGSNIGGQSSQCSCGLPAIFDKDTHDLKLDVEQD